MPAADVVVESDVARTFRVEQVAGMFDVDFDAKMRHEWSVNLPIEDHDWRIGAIVGPSGAGKTVIARRLFGDAYHRGFAWPKDKSVLDAFPKGASISDVTSMLTSVGFSSPPSWAKPYHVLSNGEKFRVELARLLMADRDLVVVDEFTSVVDRTVAKIGSAAVAKTLRRRERPQLIVLSCHYDILEWLAPDWVYDLRDRSFSWAHLQRPAIEIDVYKAHNRVWELFAPHHYLNTKRLPQAQCFVGVWGDELVGCVMVVASFGHKGVWRESRCVVLPDYQGIGIGGRLSDAVAQTFIDRGLRYTSTVAHPARVRYFTSSPKWRIIGIQRAQSAANKSRERAERQRRPDYTFNDSRGRAVISVEYVGDRGRADAPARRLIRVRPRRSR